MDSTINGLLVMGRETGERIASCLRACGIQALMVPNCNEARLVLRGKGPVQVILAEERLPDGDWRSLLDEVERAGINAEVIVCTRLGDSHLWCEVLQSGGYDLLSEPYEPSEIRRVVESAALRAMRRPPASLPKHVLRRTA